MGPTFTTPSLGTNSARNSLVNGAVTVTSPLSVWAWLHGKNFPVANEDTAAEHPLRGAGMVAPSG